MYYKNQNTAMDQLENVLVVASIDKAHTVPQRVLHI